MFVFCKNKSFSWYINLKGVGFDKLTLFHCPNPFVTNAPLPTFWKHENIFHCKVFGCFQGVEKGRIGKKLVKIVRNCAEKVHKTEIILLDWTAPWKFVAHCIIFVNLFVGLYVFYVFIFVKRCEKMRFS